MAMQPRRCKATHNAYLTCFSRQPTPTATPNVKSLCGASAKNQLFSLRGVTFTEIGFTQASTSKVDCYHFSSDGNLLATGDHDEKAVLWYTDTLKLKSTLEEHSLLMTDVWFSPSMPSFTIFSFGRTVRIWDAIDNVVLWYTDTSKPKSTLEEHSLQITDVRFSPSMPRLANFPFDKTMRVWDATDNVKAMKLHGTIVFALDIDGGIVAVSDGRLIRKTENEIEIFDCVYKILEIGKRVTALIFGDWIPALNLAKKLIKKAKKCNDDTACLPILENYIKQKQKNEFEMGEWGYILIDRLCPDNDWNEWSMRCIDIEDGKLKFRYPQKRNRRALMAGSGAEYSSGMLRNWSSQTSLADTLELAYNMVDFAALNDYNCGYHFEAHYLSKETRRWSRRRLDLLPTYNPRGVRVVGTSIYPYDKVDLRRNARKK